MYAIHVDNCKHTYRHNASMLSKNMCKLAYMNNGIGQVIRNARTSIGWSQEMLAEKISRITGQGFSRAALAQIESGITKAPKPHNLQAACDAMSIDFRSALAGKLIWIDSGVTQKRKRSSDLTEDKLQGLDKDVLTASLIHVQAYLSQHSLIITTSVLAKTVTRVYEKLAAQKQVSDDEIARFLADAGGKVHG